jgi:hypothetical protein
MGIWNTAQGRLPIASEIIAQHLIPLSERLDLGVPEAMIQPAAVE